MYQSIKQIKEKNKAIGNHWFSKSTMEFFKTRLPKKVLAGRYFVTSEQPPNGKRVYTLRMAKDSGAIETLTDMFSGLSKARLEYIAENELPSEFYEAYEFIEAAWNEQNRDKVLSLADLQAPIDSLAYAVAFILQGHDDLDLGYFLKFFTDESEA